ncbi:MAG: DUF1593 domain-containing protein [Lachnospiraceae bacterium]|nr:DUF1593 domain-containing protein [Lachnospiraceae bacterium]
MKIRTIITQDAEVDDQNSLRHFLFYANEVDLQGIVQTSSKFHWVGVPGAVKPEKRRGDDFGFEDSGPFDAPYRWPGTDWMFRVIDDYEKDYPNLIKHADGYPTPDYLRSITKIGNIGYEGEVEQKTEGSELIRERILDDDERTLYLQVWGGTNTIARALMDIYEEYGSTPEWPALKEKITKKVVITACGEQDPAYRDHVAELFPGIPFIKTLQMRSYAYPWFVMPEGDSKDTLKAEFMKKEILCGKSALADGYCTWLDGKRYEGEGEEGQFGANPDIIHTWFGAKMGLPPAQQYDFLSEGDSPTYFALFDWGFRTLEDFSYGGMAGRYHKVEGEVNDQGEPLNLWDVSMDHYVGRDGKDQELESMWPHVGEIQRDFAARIDWASKERFDDAEHAPSLKIAEGTDFEAAPGEKLVFHAEAASPDGAEVTVSYEIYKEASAACAAQAELSSEGCQAELTIPVNAAAGDCIHVVVKAEAGGHYRLVHYQQIIVRIR